MTIIGKTYRLIVLVFVASFLIIWIKISWSTNTMYVPPEKIQYFLTALLGGKYIQSMQKGGQ